jgi:hypothetical protein
LPGFGFELVTCGVGIGVPVDEAVGDNVILIGVGKLVKGRGVGAGKPVMGKGAGAKDPKSTSPIPCAIPLFASRSGWTAGVPLNATYVPETSTPTVSILLASVSSSIPLLRITEGKTPSIIWPLSSCCSSSTFDASR